MAKILLLVERGLLKSERVDDIVDLFGRVLDTLLGLFSRCVGAGVYMEGVSLGAHILAWRDRRGKMGNIPKVSAPRVIIWQSTS